MVLSVHGGFLGVAMVVLDEFRGFGIVVDGGR